MQNQPVTLKPFARESLMPRINMYEAASTYLKI